MTFAIARFVEARRPEAPGALLAELPPVGEFAPVSIARCACGGLRSDHITERPLAGGWCILVKNHRTAKLPGVRPIVAVLS
jgi:hypothetical protein